ncbi:MAG: hypothetical protein AN487_23000 [Anabaena sp. CRKS33]|nr:MAG: hypothetical protein AN487_23000 [Anabaena sp. CRKS33]
MNKTLPPALAGQLERGVRPLAPNRKDIGMFTPQTEAALAQNIAAEAGQPWPVTMNADVYRELVFAARQWDALRRGAANQGATVALVPQRDGSICIEPR